MINRPEDVLERRVDAALGGGRRTPLDRAATMVLLVGAGSPRPRTTPKWPAPHGCCGRAGAMRAWRPPS